MFERFNDRARQVVVLAQEEARGLKHNYIGTEHILLGLIREGEGLAARVLESLDITLERVRANVVQIVGTSDEVTAGQIPFTPRAKKVLELGLREALSLGHNYIGTEHILLGLLREKEGVAARILLDFDADSEKIRHEVIRMLSGPGGRGPAEEYARARPAPSHPGPALPVTPAGPAFAGHVGQALQRAAQLSLHDARGVDDGDLLLALTETAETLSGWALQRAGVDRRALESAVREVRQLEQELSATTEAKEKLIGEESFEEAAKLRDKERRLKQRRGFPRAPEAEDEGTPKEDG